MSSPGGRSDVKRARTAPPDAVAGEGPPSPSEDEDEVPVAAVVKLGGAAITWKDTFETVNEPALKACAAAIAKAVKLEEERFANEDTKRRREGRVRKRKGMVIVHGAGSFGHFQARRYGVSKGVFLASPSSDSKDQARDGNAAEASVRHGAADASVTSARVRAFDAMRDNPELLRGIAETRQSVTKLNHLVVAALLAEGVPAVGLSPFWAWAARGGGGGGGSDCLPIQTSDCLPIQTSDCLRIQTSADTTAAPAAPAGSASAAVVRSVRAALAAGLVPVIHGDVVMDDERGCAILSGDTLTRELAAALRPDRAVFLTDVLGVFDRPPTVSLEGSTKGSFVGPGSAASSRDAEAKGKRVRSGYEAGTKWVREKVGTTAGDLGGDVVQWGGFTVLLREISVGEGHHTSTPQWKVEKAVAMEQYVEEEEEEEEEEEIHGGNSTGKHSEKEEEVGEEKHEKLSAAKEGRPSDEARTRTRTRRGVVRCRKAAAGAAASAAAAAVVGTTSADAALTLTTAAHDVTGGIAAKVSEAGAVCAATEVFIAAAGTTHAAAAVVGAVDKRSLTSSAARGAERDEEWLGTYVRASTSIRDED